MWTSQDIERIWMPKSMDLCFSLRFLQLQMKNIYRLRLVDTITLDISGFINEQLLSSLQIATKQFIRSMYL